MSEKLVGATGFKAHFLIPAFFEGRVFHSQQHPLPDGRWHGQTGTPGQIHARLDVRLFHQLSARLCREKTTGRIKANQIERFLLAEICGDVSAHLMALHDNVV